MAEELLDKRKGVMSPLCHRWFDRKGCVLTGPNKFLGGVTGENGVHTMLTFGNTLKKKIGIQTKDPKRRPP